MLRDFSAHSERPYGTRHEHLSSSAAAPTIGLVSAPQATFEVTTLDDIVDATDGVLSLREAIDLANTNPGLDTITFAESLRGGTIRLVLGDLEITDDLVIDGDPANLGSAGIIIEGGGTGSDFDGLRSFTLDGVRARFEDLTIEGGGYAGIRAIDSDLTVARVAIRGIDSNPGSGFGIDASAGRVAVLDSIIGYTNSPNNAVSVRIDGTTLLVENSRLVGNTGEYGFGILGSGAVVVQDSTIADNGAITGAGISVQGKVVVEGSTFARNGSRDGIGVSSAIRVDGDLQLLNSTIADTRTASVATYGASGAAIGIEAGGTGRFVNSTITGSNIADSGTPGTGLFVGPDARVTLTNSIVDDSAYLAGTLDATGPNTLRDFVRAPGSGGGISQTNGAPLIGVDPTELFAATKEIGTSGVRSGVLADNGGPTETVALSPVFANPALDSGRSDLALDAAGDPLVFDQRGPGFPRSVGGGVDLGAVELQTPPVIPDDGLVVTTLDDVVRADGLVSLREAIETANRNSGLDAITFDESLFGGTILLELGPLTITDEVVIDGDPLNRGAAGITIDGGYGQTNRPSDSSLAYGFTGFVVDGAAARFEDLTIQNSADGINARAASLDLERVIVTGSRSPFNAFGIRGDGSLAVRDSTIADNDGIGGAGIRFAGDVVVERSTIEKNGSEYGGGVRVVGTTRITDSSISNNGGTNEGYGVIADGALTVERSAFIGNGQTIGANGTAILVRGDLLLSNSTIADTAVGIPGTFIRGFDAAAIGIGPNSTAEIVNTTLTGSRYAFNDYARPDLGTGLYIAPGSSVNLANSIIDDSVEGTIASNGANTFRDMTIDGASSGDRLGVRAEEVFAQTKVLENSNVTAGVVADNGGPTLTVALLDDPANPALDRADPAAAPPTDQRGFLRDATPDIGAFELGGSALPPFPDDGLVVTTLDDAVDATDGVLSLREAIGLANALPGEDIITFASTLSPGANQLRLGELPITDDLTIDATGSSILVDGATETGVFDIADASVTLRAFAIESANAGSADSVGTAVRASNAKLLLEDMELAGNSGVAAGAIAATDSDVIIRRGSIEGNTGESGAILVSNGDLLIEQSTLIGNERGGVRTTGTGDLTITESTFVENAGGGVRSTNSGSIVVSASTFDSNGSTGIRVEDGRLHVVNSTIFGHQENGIEVVSNDRVTVLNSTVTGNFGNGLAFGPGITASVVNSIVLGNAIDISFRGGTLSVGSSVFEVFDFDIASEIPGFAKPEDVFATTAEIDGVVFGVLADNGGPTQTVALLDDADNPALNRADPAAAPPTDQRGFLRDATPDIGAFELGASTEPPPPPLAPPLPPLAEKVPLVDADILGAPRGLLTLTGGDAGVSFVDEFAAFQNSLGVYLVGLDGSIVNPQWAFERVEHSQPSDLASEAARPGGGPLSPGDTVLLSDLFDPADLGPGVEFGLFLVADGWSSNPQTIFDIGTLEFRSGDAAARVTDTTPQLFHIAENGVERLVLGDIMHTVDAGSPNPLSNALNPGNTGQVTSGMLDGLFTVAFEDKPLAKSDRDFNDAIFAIDLLDAGDDLFAGAGAATTATAMPAGGADLETLLAAAETV